MWYLVQSNQLERLFDSLAAVLGQALPDPLAPEVVVVQSVGMGRWLSHRIAEEVGIAANIGFPLPARFIWQVLAAQLTLPPEERDFDRPVLRWRIFKMLKEQEAQVRFPQLSPYLADDRDGRRTLELADRISDLFDQYLVYRPDLLLAWEAGAAGGWQAELWRFLVPGRGPHRARLLQLFRERCRTGELTPAGLPQRICIFGVSTLAPVYLEILAAVSSVTEIHLFHLNPCRHYWGDLASAAEMAHRRAGWRRQDTTDLSGYFESGHPLLASLGKAGREFAHLLAGVDGVQEDCFQEPVPTAMLGLLQCDILELEDRSAPGGRKATVAATDRSVRMHVCHSPLREVQVLHDSLLELMTEEPGLAPRDVLVMAPDIEAYGPAIQAVFDSVPPEKHIPWSLTDRALRADQPLVEAFLALLELPRGRCSAPAVMALLEQDAVRRRFDLDGEALANIRRWLQEAGIRWGLDQKHRAQMGLDMDDRNSWAFGLRRLFLGYFCGDSSSLFRGVAPCGPISTSDSLLLGRLAEFLDRLGRARLFLGQERGAAEWREALLGLLADFFAPGPGEEEQQALQTLRTAICSLGEACRAGGYTGMISPAVLRNFLRQELSVPAGGQAFLSGRVTFCNMVPMRSIPFAVICLLGMNDADYPRRQPRVSFDLIAATPRPGDRNRRDDDRYLFLESLLSARKVLSLSWVGLDQRDNSIRPPSVVVAELLDYLQRSYRDEAGQPVKPVTEHPLQPFSPRCFDGSVQPVSYAGEWLPDAEPAPEPIFVTAPLPAPGDGLREIDLRQLQRFWAHPVRYFLQARLGLVQQAEDELLAESEPFQTVGLERYRLADAVVQARLAGRGEDSIRAELLATGELPHAGFADLAWNDLAGLSRELIAALAPLRRDPIPPLEMDIVLGEFRLRGWLENLYAPGCVRFRPARLKARDLLAQWIEHLALNALAPAGVEPHSYQVGTEGTTSFAPVRDPQPILQHLVNLYCQGQEEPLHFFPESALAWCEAREGQREEKARSVWLGGFQRRGESDDPFYRLGLRGSEPLNEQFRELAAQIIRPLMAAREGQDAAL